MEGWWVGEVSDAEFGATFGVISPFMWLSPSGGILLAWSGREVDYSGGVRMRRGDFEDLDSMVRERELGGLGWWRLGQGFTV